MADLPWTYQSQTAADGAVFDQPRFASFNNFLKQSRFVGAYAHVSALKSDDGFRLRSRLPQEFSGSFRDQPVVPPFKHQKFAG